MCVFSEAIESVEYSIHTPALEPSLEAGRDQSRGQKVEKDEVEELQVFPAGNQDTISRSRSGSRR